jgi:hypothetical protein
MPKKLSKQDFIATNHIYLKFYFDCEQSIKKQIETLKNHGWMESPQDRWFFFEVLRQNLFELVEGVSKVAQNLQIEREALFLVTMQLAGRPRRAGCLVPHLDGNLHALLGLVDVALENGRGVEEAFGLLHQQIDQLPQQDNQFAGVAVVVRVRPNEADDVQQRPQQHTRLRKVGQLLQLR